MTIFPSLTPPVFHLPAILCISPLLDDPGIIQIFVSCGSVIVRCVHRGAIGSCSWCIVGYSEVITLHRSPLPLHLAAPNVLHSQSRRSRCRPPRHRHPNSRPPIPARRLQGRIPLGQRPPRRTVATLHLFRRHRPPPPNP